MLESIHKYIATITLVVVVIILLFVICSWYKSRNQKHSLDVLHSRLSKLDTNIKKQNQVQTTNIKSIYQSIANMQRPQPQPLVQSQAQRQVPSQPQPQLFDPVVRTTQAQQVQSQPQPQLFDPVVRTTTFIISKNKVKGNELPVIEEIDDEDEDDEDDEDMSAEDLDMELEEELRELEK